MPEKFNDGPLSVGEKRARLTGGLGRPRSAGSDSPSSSASEAEAGAYVHGASFATKSEMKEPLASRKDIVFRLVLAAVVALAALLAILGVSAYVQA